MSLSSRLIVVSHRLPITVRVSEYQQFTVERSSGGLVTALETLLQRTGGCWIGWPGLESTPEVARSIQEACGDSYELRPVSISDAEHRDFYRGCANEIIWPLFHEITSECRFDASCWDAYRQATEQFADEIESAATPKDFVWVHDYHLMLLAKALRARGSRLKLAYFHHVPFPGPDTLGKLPWRVELLDALLQFNQLGFQTQRDRRNFVACLRRWLPGEVRVRRINSKWLISNNGRSCVTDDCPISVDFEHFSELAGDADVIAECEQIRHQLPFQSIILGVDRLDYTKGILERLKGFRTFLEQNPEKCGLVTFVQLLVPSREDIPAYQALHKSIEQLISEINGCFGRPGWTPIMYMYRNISKRDLVALYRAADVALVTPVRDGMNLVAKEYCASHNETSGVLILSEFAGSAAELAEGALLVNPFDTQQIADALETALDMPRREISRRMSHMRNVIRNHDIWNWSAKLCNTKFQSLSRKIEPPIRALNGALAATATGNRGTQYPGSPVSVYS